jgi:type I restriction enzyme M protein
MTTTDRVPLAQDIEAFMERHVWPFVPDATIAERKTRVGYEIPITRYFYSYRPPRELDEIDADIAEIETEVLALLGGGRGE